MKGAIPQKGRGPLIEPLPNLCRFCVLCLDRYETVPQLLSHCAASTLQIQATSIRTDTTALVCDTMRLGIVFIQMSPHLTVLCRRSHARSGPEQCGVKSMPVVRKYAELPRTLLQAAGNRDHARITQNVSLFRFVSFEVGFWVARYCTTWIKNGI